MEAGRGDLPLLSDQRGCRETEGKAVKTGGFSVSLGQLKHGPCEGMCNRAVWSWRCSNRCLLASLGQEGVLLCENVVLLCYGENLAPNSRCAMLQSSLYSLVVLLKQAKNR